MCRRRAYTLIEVLVVIAIVAILLALGTVAVQKVRASMAKAACAHNLKQLGIACHGINQNHGRMPPAFGFFPDSDIYKGNNGLGNVFFHLLPYLQQNALYLQSRHQPASTPPQNFLFYTTNNVHQIQVPGFNCPSDPTLMAGINPATQYAPSSYAGNYLVFGNVDAHFASKNAGG